MKKTQQNIYIYIYNSFQFWAIYSLNKIFFASNIIYNSLFVNK